MTRQFKDPFQFQETVELPDPPALHTKSRGGLLFYFFYGMIVLAFLSTTLLVGCQSNQRAQQAAASPTPIVRRATSTPTATPTKTPGIRPDFERGIADPRWLSTGFGQSDATWATDLGKIASQTGARWVEMPVLLHFTQNGASFPFKGASPALLSVQQGIQVAHTQGFSVFLVPLVQIDNQPDTWVGALRLTDPAALAAWFAAYWQAWQPYVQVAQQEHVEQMAIATEWSWLAYHAPPRYWTPLIAQVGAIYTGRLSYDMNWGEASPTGGLPSWELNGRLFALGVSEYMPLASLPLRIAPGSIATLWHTRIQPMLDRVASLSGRPVFLSEVGYRDRADALYQSWRSLNTTNAAFDPQEQAAAIGAALSCVFADPRIIGTFWWGWRNTGEFDLNGQPQAFQGIERWYTQ